MKDVLIIQNGTVPDAMLSTSLISRFAKENRVHVVTNETVGGIYHFMNIARLDMFPYVNLADRYDLAVNVNPDPLGGALLNRVNARQKRGFGFDGDRVVFLDRAADLYYRARHLGIPTESSLFQLLYGLAGQTWRGEGYSLTYRPQRKQAKTVTGLAIRNPKLRKYLLANLDVNGQRMVVTPFKQNILKQIDEINKCKRLVTDDDGCMHIGVSLRKQVEYILKRPPVYKVEMFGMGNLHVFAAANS
jgi:hypothetical protein